ncbi:cytochrome P450 [Ascodesmis nigricans]|uniref:Cytochrome P450 n=1 Tax=Ascodesmis nigricans TaxID=341454 RepID=A0A4S2N7B2_9PEZI|nr:cytochrome P450 [Ascodesmis nigricans]
MIDDGIFLLTLTVLVIIQRLFFHPLRCFPGEKLAAVSLIHEAWYNTIGKLPLHAQELYKKYGDFVRTGPNQVSVNNVDALNPKHGIYERGPMYEIATLFGAAGLSTMRDRARHKIWRKIWDKGFTSAALEDYIPRVQYHVDRLMDVIQNSKEKEIRIDLRTDEFAHDVISDLGFGVEKGLQEGHGNREYFESIKLPLALVQPIGSLRMLGEFFSVFPLLKGNNPLNSAGEALFEARRSMGLSRKDIFSHLMSADYRTAPPHLVAFHGNELSSNAQVLLLAGTITISTTISMALYELSRNKDLQTRLYQELLETFPNSPYDEITVNVVKRLPYLNAVINETLRLHPPTPNGTQYIVPDDGRTIDGSWLPGGTVMRTCPFAIQRDERYFSQAEAFFPERWTTRPELIKDRNAFIPFATGPYVCVGKNLALQEIRLALANIIRVYRVSLGPSFNNKVFWDEWKDRFVLRIGPSPLVFTSRID